MMRITPASELPPVTRGMAQDARLLAQKLYMDLTGCDPRVVAAALADVLAMFLAGMRAMGGDGALVADEQTRELRERLIADHIEQVRTLLLINDEIIDEALAQQRKASG